MKKALLYAVLALSLNVFAQNPQHGLESIGNERDRTGPAQIKTHGIQSLVDFTEAGGNQAYDPGTLIPILDSSYGWQWDTIAPGWMTMTEKTMWCMIRNIICRVTSCRTGRAATG